MATTVGAVEQPAAAGTLVSRSFVGLLATQFLGALNDNMFRWLVVPIAKPVLGDDEALALGLACFTIPYLLLATHAGFLADRYSKRTVIVACKFAEIVLMALGTLAIVLGNVPLLFGVVALMGAQSALFGPAKYGSIPELVSHERLSHGNGLMALVTVVASAMGFLAGNSLFSLLDIDFAKTVGWSAVAPAAVALLGVALAGFATSLVIRPLPAADTSRVLPRNPLAGTVSSLRLLGQDVRILRTALGIAFFWMLASLAQTNIDPFGISDLALEQSDIGILGVCLVLGVGLGSVLAGLWSGGKVELGIVPLGAVGITVCSFFLFVAGSGSSDPNVSAFVWSCVWLFLLGVSSGLFSVPLDAYLQDRSDVRVRGTILAATNFITFSAILFSAGLFFVMRTVADMSASQIFLVTGLGTIPVGIYIFSLLPDATIRFVVWLATHTVYRVRVVGRENLPETGGALLVANHVSWIDGVLLLVTSSRPIRMLAYADYVENWKVRWLAKLFGVIPIRGDAGPKALLKSLRAATEAVEAGELVCIFAEGSLTRTGQLQPFQGGLLRIVGGTDAPVVPVYLDGLWGSIFSYRGGRFFWKWPRQWPYPVTILFGKPMRQPDNADLVRRAVADLGVEAVELNKHREHIPVRTFLRRCRASLFRARVADWTGTELTGGKLLAGALALRRVLLRKVLAADEQCVGLLLPPSVGACVANLSLTLSRKVAVNLNYTLSAEDLSACVKAAGITHVLTSRKFLEQKPYELPAEFVFLEDLKEQITKADKAAAAALAFACPMPLLERTLGLTKIDADELATIIFTSGSTGEPKGVMLSHHNVRSNIAAVDQLFQIRPTDVLLGVLPFFHSFGYTMTLWLPLTLDPKVVYHFNPLDARQVGKLGEKHGVTILMATPTFLRTYLKRCEKEQFAKLELAIVGAEKLPADLAAAFEERFGVAPTEGYGTTELSPLAAVNVPDHRCTSVEQKGTKLGTVGRAIPGVTAKVVDPDTRADRGTGEEGLLLIKGPNVMRGYLNQPEKTAGVVEDGWYNTGDMARIDSDGFIEITGRQSRFSKIGGEMVPHIKIEEILLKLVDDPTSEEAGVPLVVTSVPDPKRGERLVVLHRPLPRPLDQVIRELNASGLPNLWIPGADSFVEVEVIPVLGTGKLDLKAVQILAKERFTAPVAAE